MKSPLLDRPGWRIQLAFFSADPEALTPDYEIGMDLLDNGISRNLSIDYGDYTIRGTLKGFGLKLGTVSQGRFVSRVRALIAETPILQAAIEPLLGAWQGLRLAFVQLDRLVRRAAAADPICRLLMTAPGVGSVVALAFRTGIDHPNRFAKSRLVGAHLGLTPRKYASGRIDRDGRITKCGDAMVRGYLFEAANSILSRLKKPCALRDWALELAERTSAKHAKVALARRLAILLHRMWLTGEAFRWPPAAA